MQDALLEPGQLGAGIDAQFLGEQPARVGVHGECLGLSAATVKGQHQELPQPFPQRMRVRQGGQLGYGLGMVTDLQIQVEAAFQQLESPFEEPGPLVLGEGPGHSGQGFAVPQLQRAVQELPCAGEVSGRAGLIGVVGAIAGLVEIQRTGGQS